VVSGGHTQIINAKSYFDMQVVATTLDDSVGESFDKVAKMLNLGYPGGAIIEKRAKEGDENSYNFPVALKNKQDIAFSYSGLKNAVRISIQNSNLTNQDINNISASFQKSAFLHILMMLKRYHKKSHFKKLSVVGGVSANLYFRQKLQELAKELKFELFFAPLEYCSDNAVMIGLCGIDRYNNKSFDSINLDVNSRVKL
jgi:N6-L-threonylcarbamoyladenine synthase